MIARILPPDEWWKLAETDAAAIWPKLNAETTEVVVVERDGEVVGHHILLPVLHVEHLWIHPADRGKTAVARALWTEVQKAARGRGVTGVWTTCDDDRVRRLLEHVQATRVQGDHYLIALGG